VSAGQATVVKIQVEGAAAVKPSGNGTPWWSTAFAPALAAAIAGLFALGNLLRQSRSDRDKEKSRVRLTQLDPLRVAAIDLYRRLNDLSMELKDVPSFPLDNTGRYSYAQFTVDLHFIKGEGSDGISDVFPTDGKSWSRYRNDLPFFRAWVNANGHNAMVTLYSTAMYFYYARNARFEFPSAAFSSKDAQLCFAYINDVRRSLGTASGIWPALQDSIGIQMRNQADRVAGYQEFCDKIIDKEGHIWFLRLIDFYKDAHMKLNEDAGTKYEIPSTIDSLEQLIRLLNQSLGFSVNDGLETSHDKIAKSDKLRALGYFESSRGLMWQSSARFRESLTMYEMIDPNLRGQVSVYVKECQAQLTKLYTNIEKFGFDTKDQNQFDLASQHFEQCYFISKSLNDRSRMGDSLLNQGEARLAIHDATGARRCIEAAIVMFEQIKKKGDDRLKTARSKLEGMSS